MSRIDHVTKSETPHTAREAFGSDYYPPRSKWNECATVAVYVAVTVAGLLCVAFYFVTRH